MRLKMLLTGVVMSGLTGFAAAQTVPFGGPVKDFLTMAQTQAVQSVAGQPVKLAADATPGDVFSADQGDGLLLYRKMDAADHLVLTSCYDGAGCLELMKTEAASFSAFSDTYEAKMPALYLADKALGNMAHKLAADTCNESAYSTNLPGGQAAVTRLAYAQNLALRYLKALQKAAGREGSEIAFCQFQVSY